MTRNHTPLDHAITQIDQALKALAGGALGTGRENPSRMINTDPLGLEDARRAARLMRINHTGEVCAQALYQGQAMTSTDPAIRQSLVQAATEEGDHLRWCADRLHELNARPSHLNPLFYGGALLIGALNGAMGDRWNLGFLAETERQVVDHLSSHLSALPQHDQKSRAVVRAMQADEATHAQTAVNQGAIPLPFPVRTLMQQAAKLMVLVSARI